MFSFVSPQFGQLGPLFSDNVLCVWRNKVPMMVEIMMVIRMMTMMKKITKTSQGSWRGGWCTGMSFYFNLLDLSGTCVLVMLREVHCKKTCRSRVLLDHLAVLIIEIASILYWFHASLLQFEAFLFFPVTGQVFHASHSPEIVSSGTGKQCAKRQFLLWRADVKCNWSSWP